jgi:ubiquinone/menaquinone biosynthesis C-methylase UbiE
MSERAHPEDPGFHGTIYETRLRERYAFCLPHIQHKDVLDVPCGAGWGSSMLAGCASLTGLDIDSDAVRYGQTHFPNIEFIEGQMQEMPFRDTSFDVVI